MAGQLDKIIQAATKQVIADLGNAFNSTISFTKKTSGVYNTSTGSYSTTDTVFSNIKVPIEFIRSEEEGGQEMREAKIFITPDLIGNNQIDLDDELTLNFAGSSVVAQIVDVKSNQGENVYLFTVLVRF
tara:strand:+ start:30 stop:416 length:387 start_codon:yes stop_codon:yes gene_type:complete